MCPACNNARLYAPGSRRLALQKPAACFARRVKRAGQKYSYLRKSEIMIYRSQPASTGGRDGHSSPDVRRVAMDAEAREMMRAPAYGQAVWSCPANAGDKLR